MARYPKGSTNNVVKSKSTSEPQPVVDKSLSLSDLTPAEIEALIEARAEAKLRAKSPKAEETKVGTSELAQALIQAINQTKPPEKKNAFNRKANTPWMPKDGKKLKLKRKTYHHSMLLDEDILSNDEIDALNKIRPGRYCDGTVVIYRRRDRGIDIDYPVKTASQRLRLINQFGIRNLKELCEYCINEALAPKKPEFDADGDAL